MTTEQIVVRGQDYVRYTAFKSNPKDTASNPPDFSKALNVWARQEPLEKFGLFAKSAMSDCIVPLADLNDGQARTVVDKARADKVFKVDFGASKLKLEAGQEVRQYEADISAGPYLKFMQQAAAAAGYRT